MIKYIAFLRGINVGGNKIIKMEELRKEITSLGFEKVETHIQSGNLIFESKEKNQTTLIKQLEDHLLKWKNFEVIVCLRTINELVEVAKIAPFEEGGLEKNPNLRYYVTFLKEKPSEEKIKLLLTFQDERLTMKVIGNEIYSVWIKGEDKHPFSNNFIENKLKISATTRDWKVVKKIVELYS